MTRTIEHGNSNGFASLGAGGLSQESFRCGCSRRATRSTGTRRNRLHAGRQDFAAMTDDERWMTITLAAQFIAGEESVTQDLQPFIAAMATENRLRRRDVSDPVRVRRGQARAGFPALVRRRRPHQRPARVHRVQRRLDADLYQGTAGEPVRARASPPRRNQIRASVTYNHVIEGALALTGYYAWRKVCTSRGILPGMQKIIKHIGDDERRHMAWGTFTCRRHVAADDASGRSSIDRMGELMGLAAETVDATFRSSTTSRRSGSTPTR